MICFFRLFHSYPYPTLYEIRVVTYPFPLPFLLSPILYPSSGTTSAS